MKGKNKGIQWMVGKYLGRIFSQRQSKMKRQVHRDSLQAHRGKRDLQDTHQPLKTKTRPPACLCVSGRAGPSCSLGQLIPDEPNTVSLQLCPRTQIQSLFSDLFQPCLSPPSLLSSFLSSRSLDQDLWIQSSATASCLDLHVWKSLSFFCSWLQYLLPISSLYPKLAVLAYHLFPLYEVPKPRIFHQH